MVVTDSGHAYIGSTGFDLVGGGEPRHSGIAHVAPSGKTRLVASGMAFPNGVVVADDDSALVVAESQAHG